MHFGGVLIGYEKNSSDNLKWRGSAIIGGGDVSAYTGKKKDSVDGSWYFMAQPFLSLKFGEDQKFYPALSGGWRFHSSVKTPGTNNWTLGGPFAGISGTYGSF